MQCIGLLHVIASFLVVLCIVVSNYISHYMIFICSLFLGFRQ